ncbi:neural cell adhesion molecule 2-like, partial [Diaphorina citri]|uniref:Neural cell adhesion molecule 2-like n=1 Tax=Diaphorina citri TaxID=121845 RepID=A0A3Q0J2R2_DIACI
PPNILDTESTPSSVAVREEFNITLTCKAEGFPAPEIKWRREDNQPISINKRKKVHMHYGEQLNITKISRTEMGAYLCIATNNVPPSVSKRITVDVEFPPMIWVPNQLVGAPVSTDVTVDCQIEAYPRAISYWMFENSIILESKKYHLNFTENSYRAHMKMTVKNLESKDFGSYKCISKNSLGETEGSIRLYEIPMASKPPKATEMVSGANKEERVSVKTIARVLPTKPTSSAGGKHRGYLTTPRSPMNEVRAPGLSTSSGRSCIVQSRDENHEAASLMKPLGRKPCLPTELEQELVKYLLEMESIYHGLTRQDVRVMAFLLAKHNNISHTFNANNGMAGRDWLAGFLKRHSQILSVRKPTGTSHARAKGFNREVDKFFNTLEELHSKHNFTADRMFNVDETGLTIVESKMTEFHKTRETEGDSHEAVPHLPKKVIRDLLVSRKAWAMVDCLSMITMLTTKGKWGLSG